MIAGTSPQFHAECWKKALVSSRLGLPIEPLQGPQNMATGFLQNEWYEAE